MKNLNRNLVLLIVGVLVISLLIPTNLLVGIFIILIILSAMKFLKPRSSKIKDDRDDDDDDDDDHNPWRFS